jgi:hypothetical protein
MNFGFKVSQTGNSVFTAPKEKLVFSSQYNTLKVYVSGSGQVMVPPFTGTYPNWTPGKMVVAITHNLGYKPMFVCFVSNPLSFDDTRMAPYTYKGIDAPWNQPNYAVDTTRLYITIYSGWNVEYLYYYRYHIYYNEIGEVETH